ncbi:hypothetical protein BU15DRAFT_77270 [Melanogaster broomeanus]|nr:hypothetical protein BU15DRAFT_77270 [Melanogaster broomeanus]
MDHILEHSEEPMPDLGAASASASHDQPIDLDEDNEDAAAVRALTDGGDVEAKSIKCSICSKTFRNTVLANYHAEKSGHDLLEESDGDSGHWDCWKYRPSVRTMSLVGTSRMAFAKGSRRSSQPGQTYRVVTMFTTGTSEANRLTSSLETTNATSFATLLTYRLPPKFRPLLTLD